LRVRNPAINADEFACPGNGRDAIGGRRVSTRSYCTQFLEKVADPRLKQGANRGEPLRPDPNCAALELRDLAGGDAEGGSEIFLADATLFAA
jgi:hypothetical protein